MLCVEPCFDQCASTQTKSAERADTPNILFNGGKPVYVPLRPPSGKGKQTSSADWKLNIDDLRAATTRKTRMLIFKCVRYAVHV